MIWEEYSKIRENLDEYVKKVTDGSGEIVFGRRGKEADVVLMSRGHYTMMKAELEDLKRVRNVLDALEEYTSYRKEVREEREKHPQPVSKRIGAGVGLFDIPDDFFDDDFEPDEDDPEDQAVSGKAEPLRVAV